MPTAVHRLRPGRRGRRPGLPLRLLALGHLPDRPPAHDLLYPGRASDFALVVAMAEQGGAFPRWPTADGDSETMFGAPADIVFS